ncbi:MAG TPA: CHAT domain-containing tetratricopeptide repeat protein [Bryobacteraceae bacterium]|jgi:CHAT domain-containing protein|nr:CHAT domain-containing tetratricopeptide repeat protein [Bryobacteraceae bacterium]
MMQVLRTGLTGLFFAIVAVAQPDLLQTGKTTRRSIDSGESHRYSLDLPSGQLVRISFLQSLPVQLIVKLLAPGGEIIVESSSRAHLLVSGVTKVAGQHSLEVTAPKSAAAASGQYTIQHIEIRPASPEDDAMLKADATYSQYRRAAAPASSLPDAAAKLDAAAAFYSQIRQPDMQGWTLLLAGQYRVLLSDHRQASDRYFSSAEAFRQAKDDVGRARALDYVGDVCIILRDYPKAIGAATEQLPLARANHLLDLEAGALATLGRAYQQQGDGQRALENFQQALALARTLGDHVRVAAVLGQTASLYNLLGDHEKALANYQEALVLHQARKAPLQEAAALSNIGSAYGSLHQPAKAVEYLERAVALFRTTSGGRVPLATTLSDCGQAYIALKSYEKAAPLLEESLAISRETGNRWTEAYTMMNLGRAHHALGDLVRASELFNGAVVIQHKLGDARVEAVTQAEIARLERGRGNLEAAREHSAVAVDLVESLRGKVSVADLRSSLVASASEYYELHVDLLMQLHKRTGSLARLEEARDAADRRRARNLRDVLTAAGVESSATRDPALDANEQRLRQQLAQLSTRRTSLLRTKPTPEAKALIDRQIDDTWIEYQTVRSKLLATNPLALSAAESAPIGLEAIRREVLDPDTILLEYSVGEPRSYLWVVSQSELKAFELPRRAQIDDTSRTFWNAVKTGGDAAAVERAARDLSHIVLEPAAGLVANKRLLIVADGALQYVPFAALPDPSQAAYRPLIAAHEILAEPSASALALLRRGAEERRPATRSLAVFADPVFEKDDPRLRPNHRPAESTLAFLTRAADLQLTRLPSTRQEGRLIAALLPESQRWLALDFEANRAAATSARLNDYRILHFATHGVVESSQPELSALALSFFDVNGKPQDGFLRLYEIYNLKMQADLVVLSACDTALGKDIRGEGLVGLARGFMHAGAPRVVASLWKVDDQATSELMRAFYGAMLGPQKKPAAAALRAAQLAVAKQPRWRSPYYWAAFVLQGEWR